jgi:hypothetical protein
VVTETRAGSYDDTKFPFRVVRRAGVIRLWQLVRASDVIHAAGTAFLPLFLAALSRKRFVVERHGYQATCFQWLSRAATTNIAVTSHVDRRQKLPRTKVIYHGIEDPLPNPGRSTSSQKLRIACVGRLAPEKGIPGLSRPEKF